MTDKNIKKDDIVTLCTNNHLNSAVPFIASQFIGARMANLDPSFSYTEMSHLVKQVRPKILFIIPEVEAVIEKIVEELNLDSEIVVFGTSDKHTEYSHFLQPHKDEKQFKPIKIENLMETAIIYFSSGTSGMPKGICLNHYALLTHVFSTPQTDNPDYEYMASQGKRASFPLTLLSYTSLYWISAGSMLLAASIDGYCRLICSDYDGAKIWKFIEKYKPMAVVLTPVQAIEMLAKKPNRDINVRSVFTVIIIGSGISREYSLKIKKEFLEADIVCTYGLTEATGSVTMFKAHDAVHRSLMQKEEKIESVGLPIKGISYKVLLVFFFDKKY